MSKSWNLFKELYSMPSEVLDEIFNASFDFIINEFSEKYISEKVENYMAKHKMNHGDEIKNSTNDLFVVTFVDNNTIHIISESDGSGMDTTIFEYTKTGKCYTFPWKTDYKQEEISIVEENKVEEKPIMNLPVIDTDDVMDLFS